MILVIAGNYTEYELFVKLAIGNKASFRERQRVFRYVSKPMDIAGVEYFTPYTLVGTWDERIDIQELKQMIDYRMFIRVEVII